MMEWMEHYRKTSQLMQRIKGKASRKLLMEFKHLKRPCWGRHVWARGFFAASRGNVTDEVMCSTYKAFGSVGLITSGGGRDLLQVKDLGYPVFTGSTLCAHAYCHILHVDLPIAQ